MATSLFTDENGATWNPWRGGHGTGYRVTRPGQRDLYVYLTPGPAAPAAAAPGIANVLLYMGYSGSPDEDSPVSGFDVDEETITERDLPSEPDSDDAEALYEAEALLRRLHPASSPDWLMWRNLADHWNRQAFDARYGLIRTSAGWADFNEAACAARAFYRAHVVESR
jgi:hypothetical protein